MHSNSRDKGRDKGASKTAGFLYAIDVFGASAGALLSGAILIPVFVTM